MASKRNGIAYIDQKELDALRELEVKIGKKFTRLQTGNQSEMQGEQLNYTTKNRHVTSLSLGSSHLTEIPKEIQEFSHIESLWISGNEITNLPENLRNLKELRTLHARYNQITKVPSWFGELMSLETVYLSHNRISGIPKEFGRLRNLRELYMVDNQMLGLPNTFGDLSTLKHVNLADNSLIQVPESIGSCKELTVVNLAGNQLSKLPESFQKLIKLSELSLARNRFTSIPGQLWSLKNLTKLNLSGNPLDKQSEELIGKKMDVIREYCRRHAPIHVYLSYDKKDMRRYEINRVAQYLRRQPEIYDVNYYDWKSESTEVRNYKDHVGKHIDRANLVIFFITTHSVKASSNIQQDLQICKEKNICMALVVNKEIGWPELRLINLNNELQMKYENMSLSSFLNQLYEFIVMYKREVNMFNRYIAKFEVNKLLIRNYFLEIIDSPEFEQYYYANFNQISNYLDEIGDVSKKRALILRKLFDNFGKPR